MTVEVYEPSRSKHSFFKVNESNAPASFVHGFAAMPAFGLTARRGFGAVDTWKASMSHAGASGLFQRGPVFDSRRVRIAEGFQQRLRPFVCGTHLMEPQRHVSFGERVWQALPKTQ